MTPYSFPFSARWVLALALALMLLTAVQVSADSDTGRPSIIFSAPASATLSDTITVTISASDAGGIESMAVNFHKADRSFVKRCGSVKNLSGPTAHTFSCEFDTNQLPDGVYELRAGAFDEAHNNRTIWEWVTIENGEVEA